MPDPHNFNEALECLLGLQRPWTMSDLNRQHRLCVLKWHPDRNPCGASHDRMARANHARDVLRVLVAGVPGGVVEPTGNPPPEPPPNPGQDSADPTWTDMRHKGGGLWWERRVPPETRLPNGWQRAGEGRPGKKPPKRPGQPWTKRTGPAHELVAELERWLAARAAG